jgi:hypothetical protein
MIDGTALGLFHMPQPDIVPEEAQPLSVILTPISPQLWRTEQVFQDQRFPSGSGFHYYIWAPGNNQSGWRPEGVDWANDSARMFRCLEYGGQRCITYYVVRSCEDGGGALPRLVLSVSRQGNLSILDMFSSFELVDDAARRVTDTIWKTTCEERE